VRLHVGVCTSEYGFQPVDGQLLGLVNPLATGIIPAAWISFRIFIGHHRACGLHHLQRGEVFRSNQLQPVALAVQFIFDDIEDLLISLHMYS
jgi:hypothetical protein